ncbi:MAG: iron ABC transporter permease [Burkholderiaceae bacterium]|nr:iron ABC transporter permease [Burkholderiaceae bacterium]
MAASRSLADARARRALVALTLAGGAALLVALAIGSVALPVGDIAAALVGAADPVANAVMQLRLPRALSAFAAGGLLGLSGAILQALLRNPLADPYVLGISGGAAVAALGALALGASLAVMQAASAAGALAALALLFALARQALFMRDALHGEEATTRVLLTGVMIAAFCSALLSVILTLAPEAQLRTMVFWLLGDLGGATDLRQALVALAVLALGLVLAGRQARALNLMLRGDVQATTQGVDVERERRALVLIAALATGTAVMLAGAVGFVGFVAPHLLRLTIGNDQRYLLPAAALAGGVLVLAADTVARTAFAPLQLPVGVVTALVGVPVFLWLLARRARW